MFDFPGRIDDADGFASETLGLTAAQVGSGFSYIAVVLLPAGPPAPPLTLPPLQLPPPCAPSHPRSHASPCLQDALAPCAVQGNCSAPLGANVMGEWEATS